METILSFERRKFREFINQEFGPQDKKKIFAALQFATHSHKGQRRDEGIPYIVHPIRVARIMTEEVGTWDSDIVVAALLHDVVEDCQVSKNEIKKRFGQRVADFVSALTRKCPKKETEEQKEQRKIKSLASLAKEPLEIQFVKCADILDNMRSSAAVPFYSPPCQKFPRWQREFKKSIEFVKDMHPLLYREMQKAFRKFKVKCIARGLIRLGS